MSSNKAIAGYMLLLAVIAAIVLGTSPLELWIRWVMAGLVAGVEFGIAVSALVAHHRGHYQRRRDVAPE